MKSTLVNIALVHVTRPKQRLMLKMPISFLTDSTLNGVLKLEVLSIKTSVGSIMVRLFSSAKSLTCIEQCVKMGGNKYGKPTECCGASFPNMIPKQQV